MEGDEKEVEASSTRGADWEVVSLTASTYAAAPGPEGLNPDDRGKDGEFDKTKQETPEPMFMSGHFVFPPNEHENLPIELERSEIQPDVQDISHVEEGGGGSDETYEEITRDKSDVDPHGVQLFDNGSNLSNRCMDFEEVKESQELNLIGEEKSMYISTEFSVSRAEIDQSGSVLHIGSSYITEPADPPSQNVDALPKYSKPNEEDESDGSSPPNEAWWKRHAACFYRNAKETNTLWSVVVAAALMGLVILGKRWQQEKWHLQQLKLKLNINDEPDTAMQRLSQMLGPIGRFKDILIGGRSPSIRGAASANHR